MRRYLLLIFSLLISLLVGFSSQAYFSPGKPAGFVNDYAGLLSSEQKNSLESKLSQFAKDSSNEISVVTLKSLEGDTIENFANKLFTDWGIGQAKNDNGLLLLISLNDRQMRLETGYGLEGAVPDATANQIITKTLRPAFQANDYYGGINQALDQIILATRGEYAAEPLKPAKFGFLKNISLDTIFFIILFIFYLLAALRRRLAKSKAWWEGGIIGLVIGLIIALIFFRTLFYFLILPGALAVGGLIFDYLVSRVLPPPKPGNKKGGGFWIFPGGFGGGASGGFGGGFGGFGGGASGGGGSSGSW